ncbi:MAG: imidazole glycerol phosphate synthase subunit HisH [Oscillospiraceae bacterium]|jgi:glutamine amidotransferase|nr:imidazole glycerol phosphate synthase subunit HisH [Oscillospiraceae bacterium]
MTLIINYGVGNLFSLKSALSCLGVEAQVSGEPEAVRRAERLILPGVGAFGDAREKLRLNGLDRLLQQEAASGKPLMGICLGMQLLFDRSFEYGETEGLHLVPGEVRPIAPFIPKGYKIPHIGWNALRFGDGIGQSEVFKYISDGDCMYFVHSFAARGCAAHTIATTEYGVPLTAAVQRDRVFGMQFHPEKSGRAGLNILKAFCEIQ